ncbi:hypothetical protein N656DRAFT_843088 [Canariomyces notabilis]|uniref:Uncharacterized protein n=1 Tax=Canariomyces notabilis TaxID=2074819 RepID=A0AAN6YV90_9PEZI|nr:hypothetical protein N656DRAFT_843088 [Canariomyces arenarius]
MSHPAGDDRVGGHYPNPGRVVDDDGIIITTTTTTIVASVTTTTTMATETVTATIDRFPGDDAAAVAPAAAPVLAPAVPVRANGAPAPLPDGRTRVAIWPPQPPMTFERIPVPPASEQRRVSLLTNLLMTAANNNDGGANSRSRSPSPSPASSPVPQEQKSKQKNLTNLNGLDEAAISPSATVAPILIPNDWRYDAIRDVPRLANVPPRDAEERERQRDRSRCLTQEEIAADFAAYQWAVEDDAEREAWIRRIREERERELEQKRRRRQ